MNARVPCPLCGGPLHPIAGRCKHCKQDLSVHRSRAGAPFLPMGPPGSLPQLASFPGDPSAVIALGVPGYPAGELRAARHGWARNWPLIVILLAVIGMIIALLLLVLPQRDSTVRRNGAPLHNDRMDTNTLPGSGRGSAGAVDPWQSGPSSRAPQPAAPDRSSGVPGAADPDDLSDPSGLSDPADPSDPDVLDDPGGSIAGGITDPDDVAIPDLVPSDPSDPSSAAPSLPDPFDPLASSTQLLRPSRSNFLTVMAIHLCQRAAACGSDPMMSQVCEHLARPSQPRPTRCFHPLDARFCLRAIDSLSCDHLPTMSTLQSIPFCMKLMAC